MDQEKGISEDQYLEKRRILIAAAAANNNVVEESNAIPPSDIFDNAPQLPPETVSQPPQLTPPPTPIVAAPTALPTFDAATITNEQFVSLCEAFCAINGDSGSNFLNNKIVACGMAPGTSASEVQQQDIISWITNQVYGYGS